MNASDRARFDTVDDIVGAHSERGVNAFCIVLRTRSIATLPNRIGDWQTRVDSRSPTMIVGQLTEFGSPELQ